MKAVELFRRRIVYSEKSFALLSAGPLNRTETGNAEFPYEAVKVEFLLQAA
jgi:hypothetical protein